MNESVDPTTVAWPHWLMRYVGSDDEQAMWDLIWSVGGSPPYGGVSDDEAAAVYELLEDYRGPGCASPSSYDRVAALLDPESQARIALEVFRCADEIQSDSEGYGHAPVQRGLELAERLGARGATATFLAYHAGWLVRAGDVPAARDATIEALDQLLEIADGDAAYELRVRQCATNAISFTAIAGDVERALHLLAGLVDVLDDTTADQLRRSLQAAR